MKSQKSCLLLSYFNDAGRNCTNAPAAAPTIGILASRFLSLLSRLAATTAEAIGHTCDRDDRFPFGRNGFTVDGPHTCALKSFGKGFERYLRATGLVSQPRVRNYRLRFHGRIRSAPDARWMPFEADQQSFADQPTRLFLMHARMFALPVLVFHRLIDGHATMQVKIAGAIPMVDAQGDEMDRSEAVTLFNDMCLLAPGTLLDPGIAWEPVDARTVRAQFTNGGHTISATLLFGEDGLLANFISEDRSRASPDGKVFTRLRFSTPVRDYRDFGSVRLAAHGEARFLLPEGEFTYGEFDLQEVSYNVRR